MSVQAVAKELARLSYTDMVALAKQINTMLPNTHNPEVLADVLSNLDRYFSEDEGVMDGLKHANAQLRKVFNGRTKNITVLQVNSGWQVSVGKYSAVGETLTDALNNLTDQLVVLKTMGVV